jgi:hypothetical protein
MFYGEQEFEVGNLNDSFNRKTIFYQQRPESNCDFTGTDLEGAGQHLTGKFT